MEDGTSVPIGKRPIRNALYNNQKIESRVYYCKHKNGSRFAVAITATPVNLFGQVFGGVSVIRDITKEREVVTGTHYYGHRFRKELVFNNVHVQTNSKRNKRRNTGKN